MGSLDQWRDRVDPLVGSMLGTDYRVLEPIGLGGMAVVYLVEHQTLCKRFAAKVLSVELAANEEAHARFNQEAHAAAHLDHENIVSITDFGETADQRPFFVMELLRGQTLDRRIAASMMSIEEVVAVAVPVARALAHAHAEGIIHRDVKPENVFLVQRSQGRFGVKVVDFGIAKTPINTRLTKMGETLGSPMFMAPEACRGDDVDHRADLYSFGVLLYLMLCGRVPFEDDNLLKVLQMQVSEPLPPPRSVNPDVSPKLAAVLERALAKDPDARYLSMDALLVDLEAAVPPGADRLLVEAQSGRASSFRIHAFTGPLAGDRLIDSQQIARVASRPLPSAVSQPLPGRGSRRLPTAPSADTPPPATARAARRWRVAVPATVALAIGAWLVLARGGPAEPRAAVSGTPRASSPSVAPPAADPGERVRAAAAAPVAPPPVVPPQGTVHLRLATVPAGARVDLDGVCLGTTPLEVDLPRRNGEARLVLARDGFADLEQRVDLGADRSLSLVLRGVRPAKLVRLPPPPPPERPAPVRAPDPPEGDPNLELRLSR